MSERIARVVDGLPGGPLTLFVLADVDAALDQAIRTGARAPYGGVLWDAAPCVVAVLAELPLAGTRVLELGCGTGLVSLAAARAGAKVLATDVDEEALASTRRAAEHAGLAIGAVGFDVGSDEPLPPADLVVAADLMYEPELALALARRVREALERGSRVVVGDPGRLGRAAFDRELAGAAPPIRASFRPIVVGAHRADVAVVG